MRLPVVAAVAACALSPGAATGEPSEPCAAIEAALRVEDRGYQDFYRGRTCGGTARIGNRVVVDVVVQGEVARPFFRGVETCPQSGFVVYRPGVRVPPNKAVVRLTLWPGNGTWTFMASLFEPHIRDPRGKAGFEVRDHMCHAIGGYLRRDSKRWRAWVDVDAYLAELEAERTKAPATPR